MQPDSQGSSYFSFLAHRSSLLRLPVEHQLLAAVEAAAAPAHAAAPTAAAASVVPLACSLQGLRCFPIAAAGAAATAALPFLAAFDAQRPCLDASRATHAVVSQPQQYQSQEPDQV